MVEKFQVGGWNIFKGVEKFWGGGVEKILGGLRNFRGGGGLRNFRGRRVKTFSGGWG